MGKRKKSTRKPAQKVKQVLATQFTCLFCNHENAVICTMDKRLGIGSLSCKVCGQSFQASINALSEPIDVYSEWVDACEAVGKESIDTVGSPTHVAAATDEPINESDGEYD